MTSQTLTDAPRSLITRAAPEPQARQARRWLARWSAYCARQRALNIADPEREQVYLKREREEEALIDAFERLDPVAFANQCLFAIGSNGSESTAIIDSPEFKIRDPQQSITPFNRLAGGAADLALKELTSEASDMEAVEALLAAGFAWSVDLQQAVDQMAHTPLFADLHARIISLVERSELDGIATPAARASSSLAL